MSSNFSGHCHTVEANAKNAAAHRGRKHTAETLAKMSAARLGHVVSAETRKKIATAKTGKLRSDMVGNRFNWKGGHVATPRGRILEYSPTHPDARCNGYVFEHRLVMEKNLRRPLLQTEVVHHINGDPRDNRRENLALCNNQSSHQDVHRGDIYLPV